MATKGGCIDFMFLVPPYPTARPATGMFNFFCKYSLQQQIQDFPGGGGGGANSPGGVPTYDFAKFSRKLHEIERIWVPRGGGGVHSPAPP